MKIKNVLRNVSYLLAFNLFLVPSFANTNNTSIYNGSITNNVSGDIHEELYSVKNTKDDGYIVTGCTNSHEFGAYTSYDAFIAKYNSKGEMEWSAVEIGSKKEVFSDVEELSNGDFIAVGSTYSQEFLSPSDTNGKNGIIVKYNSKGEKQWFKSWGGNGIDEFLSLKRFSDDSVIVCGESDSTDIPNLNIGGVKDAILVKYDKNGDELWSNSWGDSGEYDYDKYESIDINSKDEIIVAGYTRSNLDGFVNNGGKDLLIRKFDAQGNNIWSKSTGGEETDEFDAVKFTSDGGAIAVGNSKSIDFGNSNNGKANGLIVKYDKNGEIDFKVVIGGSNTDNLYDVVELKNGSYIACGESKSTDGGFPNKGDYDGIIVKVDKSGQLKWIKSWGASGEDCFESLIRMNDNSIIIAGHIEFDENKPERYGEGLVVRYSEESESILKIINSIEKSPTEAELSILRESANNLSESYIKNYIQNMINNINVTDGLSKLSATSNLDIYIKSENMLLMSLSTNSITFDNYSGVDEIEQDNAVEISINSSLPYQLNAYLLDEVYNSDRTKKIDMDRLQIKDNTEDSYSEFTNINEKLVLKDTCDSGNDKSHSIDLKLKGGNAYESDIYKTVIKFEAEQK